MTDWLDMENRGDRRRHRRFPSFYLVNCRHGGTSTQKKNLRERLDLGYKMLNSILDVFGSSPRTHLSTLWAPSILSDEKKKRRHSHLTFGITIFVFFCSSICLARNYSNLVYSNSTITEISTESRKFIQRFSRTPSSIPSITTSISFFSSRKKKGNMKGDFLSLLSGTFCSF